MIFRITHNIIDELLIDDWRDRKTAKTRDLTVTRGHFSQKNERVNG